VTFGMKTEPERRVQCSAIAVFFMQGVCLGTDLRGQPR
jgi:hypothetical protein